MQDMASLELAPFSAWGPLYFGRLMPRSWIFAATLLARILHALLETLIMFVNQISCQSAV